LWTRCHGPTPRLRQAGDVAIPTSHVTSGSGDYRPRAVITDALLRDPAVPDAAKLELAVRCGRPPHNPPSTRELIGMLPVSNNTQAGARRQLAAAGIATFDYSDCLSREKTGKPARIVKLAEYADPNKTVKVAHAPVSLISRLKGRGRGAPKAVLLLFYYHSEQHRRGAIQTPDDVAAAELGWSKTVVQRARRLLIEVGILTVLDRPPGGPVVYGIAGALPGAEINLDPETGFDPTKTKRIHRILVADRRVSVIASAQQLALIELAHAKATPATLSATAQLAQPAPAAQVLALHRDAVRTLYRAAGRLPALTPAQEAAEFAAELAAIDTGDPSAGRATTRGPEERAPEGRKSEQSTSLSSLSSLLTQEEPSASRSAKEVGASERSSCPPSAVKEVRDVQGGGEADGGLGASPHEDAGAQNSSARHPKSKDATCGECGRAVSEHEPSCSYVGIPF
jgi:hypothetical protein